MASWPDNWCAQIEHLDEQALLCRLRAGDEAAYELMVRAYGGRLFAVAQRILRNEEDARDAVQSAYVAAFRALDRFEGGSLLSTWLHRIVVNAALMRLRSRRRRPEESLEPLLPTFLADGHYAQRFSDADLPADRMIEREETRALVRACIDRLPERHRAILMLRDIDDVSTGEVADALGITANAVKIRLHRARQALATLLRQKWASETARAEVSSNARANRLDRPGADGHTPAPIVGLVARQVPASARATAGHLG